ncbi:uncharacterized protein si:dkey-196h17.9 isoform X1 [Kryptolebias marmoratus]|uniref:uncharacterized protein si:dkey-196h17.9 isoform X1 n=1 Tax=Kryptolebias marmoratus TaxID=37003 RepID=UPI000D52F87A|nr:uncharacterized protein si:dkey-196h17.9 isoform X1 [Kryptolebias marmoratus]
MEAVKARLGTIRRKCSRKPQKTDSIRPLINKDLQDGQVYDNPVAHNVFNTAEEERSQELLHVVSSSFSRACRDGSGLPEGPESDSEQRLEAQDFPEPPANLDQDLREHLEAVGDVVSAELDRSCSSASRENLKNRLFAQLHDLLQNIGSSKSCFLLMKWTSQMFLRQDQDLLTRWEAEAQEKLLPHVQKETRETLSRILQLDQSQTQTEDEETFIRLYVDIIQSVSGTICQAQNISPRLHDEVQRVCFQELWSFMGSYTAEQTQILEETIQMWNKKDEVETMNFLRTLRTCEELRKYVQSKGNSLIVPLKNEIVTKLKSTKALILKLLMEIVTELAERSLKDYFKSEHEELKLFRDLKTYFPRRPWLKDEQKEVMAEAYEVIAHLYLKHLTRMNRRRARRRSSAVSQRVSSDIEELQLTVSQLAPEVRLGEVLLLSVPDVLQSNDLDALKLIMAGALKGCGKDSKDLDLIPDLVRLKGLPAWQNTEVLEALPGVQIQPGSRRFFCCCCC